MNIAPIAYIRTWFPEKFGIPRQSGLAGSLKAEIVFVPEYRSADALRGLEGFSHLWLIWGFSANLKDGWSPTVRPPRLGGNERVGVFATRSPFRPNPLGLSCVEMEGIVTDCPDGPVIHVKGADLMDGTPIYDIKPYVRYADSYPDAADGFLKEIQERRLKVIVPDDLSSSLDSLFLDSLTEVLSLDPRPSYHDDPDRIYGLSFRGYNVKFKVDSDVLTVLSASEI